MKVKEFVEIFKSKKIMTSKANPNAMSECVNSILTFKTYAPFQEKRAIAEKIVKRNTHLIDGVKKNDNISQYIDFVAAMIQLHTNLEFSDNITDDYDLLAENGLLMVVINEFQNDYNECDIILKMALAAELADNDLNIVLGKMLHNIDIIKLFNVITKLKK